MANPIEDPPFYYYATGSHTSFPGFRPYSFAPPPFGGFAPDIQLSLSHTLTLNSLNICLFLSLDILLELRADGKFRTICHGDIPCCRGYI